MALSSALVIDSNQIMLVQLRKKNTCNRFLRRVSVL